ncbi:hypothetical protein ACGFYY_38290 [Streptomyces sp. NPDC048331]|uniref:hypothetical protein n=1 Tax=Streptomyces sp. NPDC048331 TaxID=3365534 RepID=UPI003719496B
MSAAEHLAEAISVGCTRDDHDHVGDHRREVLNEAIQTANSAYEQQELGDARSDYNEGVFDAVSALYRLLNSASRVEGKGTGTTGGEPTPSDPLIVRRFDTSIEPDRFCGETEMVVYAVAEDGRPVALLLDDAARAKLASLIGHPGPGLDERALRLADHILNAGGEWTTNKAHQWVVSAIEPKPPIHFTRHSLQALAVHGYLTERREPGRVSYTPNYATGGGR